MISKQTHLMLFLAMTLSAGSIVAMEKAPQQIGTEKALQTIEIGEREILAITDRPWYLRTKQFDKFQIPKEGALLKVTDTICYAPHNNFEIKQGTEYISLSRGDAGEFEIKDNRGTLLTTIYLYGNEQK